MIFRYKIFIILSLLFCRLEAAAKRHIIYWNSFMTPHLRGGSDFVLNVRMNEFLDILCPQTSLMSITNGPEEPETFDLLNVTKAGFETCTQKGKSNFIFACDRPERENKLTIKFQTISPSPLGFRFQYCEDYYFIALPRHSKEAEVDGCHGDNSTRLHIKVACKYKPTTTTTTIRPTTTTTTTITKLQEVENSFDTESEMEIIRHPNLVRLRPPGRNQTADEHLDGVSAQQTGDESGSGCRSYRCKPFFQTMTSLLALALVRFSTSPIT